MCLDLPDAYILQFYISKTAKEAKGFGVCGMNYAHPSNKSNLVNRVITVGINIF